MKEALNQRVALIELVAGNHQCLLRAGLGPGIQEIDQTMQAAIGAVGWIIADAFVSLGQFGKGGMLYADALAQKGSSQAELIAVCGQQFRVV